MPPGLVAWSTPYDTYDPIAFTAPKVLKASWADQPLDEVTFSPKWNAVDGNIDRRSHEGTYQVGNDDRDTSH